MSNASLSTPGLALALLSAATFGTSGSFATSLIAAGWSPEAAVIARIAIAALVLAPPALWQLRSCRVTARGARTVLLFGVVAVAGAQLCFFKAVEQLSVGVALLVEYSGILLVIVWMWMRHGHRPRRLTLAGGGMALVGLALVLDLLGSHHLSVVGVLWALGAAVGLAVYFVISSTADDGLPPLVVAWGGLTVGAVALGFAGVTGVLAVDAPRTDVTLLDARVSWLVPVLGMALIAAVVSYVSGIAAARLLGARVASFVGLTEVLFAVAFAWLLLGQHLDVVQGLGGVLVVGGISLVRLDELREKTPTVVHSRPEGAAPDPVLPDMTHSRRL